jgi:hypothetical protein
VRWVETTPERTYSGASTAGSTSDRLPYSTQGSARSARTVRSPTGVATVRACPSSGSVPRRRGPAEGRSPVTGRVCLPHLVVSTVASPWQSATVTVRAGWRRVPVGSMPGTGSRKVMHRPRAPLVAMVSPRSARERCAGPAVLRKPNGPVTVVEVTLVRAVRSFQSPNRTASSPSRTWTVVVAGVMPKGRPASR